MDNTQGIIVAPGLLLNLPLYRLDGLAFMSQDSYGQMCTVTGASWNLRGRYFDGIDDDINCGNGDNLNITTEYTIEAWVNPNQSDVFQNIVMKTNIQFYVRNTNFLANSFFDGTAWRETIGTTILNQDRWYHVAGTHRVGVQKLYLNGILECLSFGGEYTTSPTSNTNNLFIGESLGSTQHWKGLVGEVRIYNRALLPSEVRYNYLTTGWRYR